jgi:MGT family glycosyltransferase
MSGSIVFFCIHGVGHIQSLLPLIKSLSDRDGPVYVLTHADFAERVRHAGARFVDLFAEFPLDAADDESSPMPSRYVSYAGVYAEQLGARVAALAPSLLIYDTFMVIAPVIARRLGIPYVNVCSGHAPVPRRVVAALRKDPRVATSARCLAAISRLRQVHGMKRANPFSYVEEISPFLNVYCEPAEFLAEKDRAAFRPLAFFGSLAPELQSQGTEDLFPGLPRRLRLYVCFGTVIWRYFEAAASAALSAIASACAKLDMDVVISLGGHPLSAAARGALAGPNVRILSYVDQWAMLRQTDVFVTHHGLNSTHEAIFHQVPMLSYPFFGDQPALARRCQQLGLALPLSPTPRAPIAPSTLHRALQSLALDRAGFAARLAQARSWELRTLAERGAVVDRIVGLRSLLPSEVAWHMPGLRESTKSP